MLSSKCQEGSLHEDGSCPGYFGQKNGVNVTVSGQTGLPGLQETWTAPQEEDGDELRFPLVVFWGFLSR